MKIEEQVLSREQMAHLQELGVDTSDASMCWLDFGDNEPMDVAVFIPEVMLGYAHCTLYPTYTIGDLIEKLPKNIEYYQLNYQLKIDWYGEYVGYADWCCEQVMDYIGDYNFENRPIIEALYDCLCWVAENHKELIM